MFTSSSTPAARRPVAGAYREVGAATAVDGASPHKLVSLLFATLSSEIACARGALERRNVAEKGRAIAHAVRIVEEGLQAPLDLERGGVLAANLQALYDYVVRTLTLANIHNDDAALGSCARVVDTLREGWDSIGEQAQAFAPAAA